MLDVILTHEIIAVLSILSFAVAMFVFEVVRVDVVALMVLVLLGLSSQVDIFNGGLVPTAQLFDGFSSNAVMSIIAVMIIGAGLDKTGVMGIMAAQILKRAGKTEGKITFVLSLCVAYISSFMQNIGAAALFLPVASRISRRTAIPLSRLLMPMGFCAILGGTMTMVGSSPLILLNDLIDSANLHFPDNAIPMETFGLFAVTPVGVALVFSGIAYFLILGKRILPVAEKQSLTTENLQHYRDVYGIDGRIFEMTVGLAFHYFAKKKVDIAIIEVGLGGRLDSTNIITPEVSVITNIGFDHMQMLGNTLTEIATEKAGIIKENIPVVIKMNNVLIINFISY